MPARPLSDEVLKHTVAVGLHDQQRHALYPESEKEMRHGAPDE